MTQRSRAAGSLPEGLAGGRSRPRIAAQVPKPSPSPIWGLHLLDANIELGNLLTVVRREAAAFARQSRS